MYVQKLVCNINAEPPGAPQDLYTFAVSPNNIEIHWAPPTDNEGRRDLYFQVEHTDPDNLGSYTGTVYLGASSSNHTFSDLRPLTQYCVRVTAHNGVSDQDMGSEALRVVEACVKTLRKATTGNINN